MANAYTLEEILKNRIRIKTINPQTKFIEIYNLCREFGELMFFDVLTCKRPLVYASFVNRDDACAAMTKINNETVMDAAFSSKTTQSEPNKSFVLDLSRLDEMEIECKTKPNRSSAFRKEKKRAQRGHYFKLHTTKPTLQSTGQISKHPERDFTCEWDDSNSVNNEKTQYKGNTVVESFANAEENIKDDPWAGWDSDSNITMETIKSNQNLPKKEPVEDEEHELSFTSWTVFNGQPKDWSKLRIPEKKSIFEYFPSLRNSHSIDCSEIM